MSARCGAAAQLQPAAGDAVVARTGEGAASADMRRGHGRARHGRRAAAPLRGQDAHARRPDINTVAIVAPRGLVSWLSVAAVVMMPLFVPAPARAGDARRPALHCFPQRSNRRLRLPPMPDSVVERCAGPPPEAHVREAGDTALSVTQSMPVMTPRSCRSRCSPAPSRRTSAAPGHADDVLTIVFGGHGSADMGPMAVAVGVRPPAKLTCPQLSDPHGRRRCQCR